MNDLDSEFYPCALLSARMSQLSLPLVIFGPNVANPNLKYLEFGVSLVRVSFFQIFAQMFSMALYLEFNLEFRSIIFKRI